MSGSLESKIRKFQSLPGVQRTVVLTYAAIVVACLLGISYVRYSDLDSPRRVILFGFLWGISIVALFLLERAWRSIPWSQVNR